MSEARSAGMILGNGYGRWKESTFRVANFPALESHEWLALEEFIHQLD